MKKAIILVALIAVLAVPVFADWRADIGADLLLRIGVTDASLGEDYSWVNEWIIPLPNGSISYNFDFGPLSLGVGGKMYTLILVSAIYPIGYVEVDLDPVVINLTAGGGAFLYFGLGGLGLTTENLFFPDLSVMFKLGKTFRLGLGAMTVLGIGENQSVFPYILYAGCKFSFPL